MSQKENTPFENFLGAIFFTIPLFLWLMSFIIPLLAAIGGGFLAWVSAFLLHRLLRPIVKVGKLNSQHDYKRRTLGIALTGINSLSLFGLGVGTALYIMGHFLVEDIYVGVFEDLSVHAPRFVDVSMWVLALSVALYIVDLFLGLLKGNVVYLSPSGVISKKDAEYELEDQKIKHYPVYTIYIDPAENKRMDFYIETFMRETLGYFGECIFRIEADEKQIRWQVVDLIGKSELKAFSEFVRAHFPKASVLLEPPKKGREYGFTRNTVVYRYSNEKRAFYRPLKGISELKAHDPLLSISQHMSTLRMGQTLRYNLLVVGNAPNAFREMYDHMHKAGSRIDRLSRYVGFSDEEVGVIPAISVEEYKVAMDRLKPPLYMCFFFTESDAQTKEVADSITDTIYKRVNEFSSDVSKPELTIDAELSRIYKVKDADFASTAHDFLSLYERLKAEPLLRKQWQSARLMLDVGEMAALWHLPDPRFTSSKITKPEKMAEVSETLAANTEGFLFGRGMREGQKVDVRIPEATLSTHQSILGKSGMGKSTYLLNLINQTIGAGHGCAVLDPHGDLVVDILQRCIPENRRKDVVVLDLNDPDVVIPFNVFSSGGGRAAIGQIASIVELAQKSSAGDQTARYFYNGLRAISHLNNPIILDLQKFLQDAEFRDKALDRAHLAGDLDVVDFWEIEYDELSDSRQRERRTPILNRIEIFSQNQRLKPMLCHPDGLPLTKWMTEKKIILLSLKSNPLEVPKNLQDLIGAIFISMLQLAGMNPARERVPFYIFADEMQRFRTPAFATIFSEARKFNLSLTIAHQFADQLDKDILSAIIGNVGTKAIFGCGQNDARRMGVTVKDAFEPTDLERLDKYTMALRTVVSGITQPSCLIRTLPPPKKPNGAENIERLIRHLSKEYYTPKSRDDVNKMLAERYPRRSKRGGRQPLPETPLETSPKPRTKRTSDPDNALLDTLLNLKDSSDSTILRVVRGLGDKTEDKSEDRWPPIDELDGNKGDDIDDDIDYFG